MYIGPKLLCFYSMYYIIVKRVRENNMSRTTLIRRINEGGNNNTSHDGAKTTYWSEVYDYDLFT
jgi:hypothetical protein